MSNRLRLRIAGLDELRHAVKAYGQKLVSSSVDAVSDVVAATEAQAQAAAPFKSGKLRRSIKGSIKTDGYSIRGTVRATAPHAHLIEFGTQRIAKKPFLVPAAIANRRKLTERIRSNIVKHAPEGLGTPRLTGDGPSTPGMGID